MKHEEEPVDEYKSRLSSYLEQLVGEELKKYEGGYTKEFNDKRKEAAEVLGYKLAGTSDVKEAKKRDYKAEYKKYGSSTKAKKYRAELNQYNRKKGTYGNGDNKDASHKGGKIVGFESQSKNRGRAEKSRLKKEDFTEAKASVRMSDIMSKLAKSLGVKSVVSMHTGSGSLSYFIDDKMEAKKLESMLKKTFKRVRLIPLNKSKGDTANFVVAADMLGLESVTEEKNMSVKQVEGYSLRDVGYSKFYKKLNNNQRQAISIALVMGGNMTGAVKAIEKIKQGLSKDKKVKNALKLANESVINEETYFDPKSEFKKYMDKTFKKVGIKVLKYDPMKQSFHNGAWGGFYTVKSSNKVDMGGKPVKRGSAVLPVYISRKGEIELGIKAGGFHIGKAGSSQVVKNLKDFKKGDLEESYKTLTEGIRVRMGEIAKQGEWEVYNPQNGKSIKVVKSSGAATRLMNRLMNSGKYDEIGSRHVETHKNENKSVTEKKGVPGSVFTIDTAKKTTELMTKVLKKVSPDIQRGQIYHSALGGTDRVSIVGKFSLDRKKTWSRNILENSRFITFHLDNDGTLEVNVNGYPFSMRKQVQMRKTRNNDIKQVLSRMVTHFSMLNKKYPEGM
jgi:hypothetical protein